jgi:cytochrome c556
MTVALVAFAGAVATAQMKVATFADYQKLMQSISTVNGAMNKAIGSSAYADATKQITAQRQNYTVLETFWTGQKQESAVKMVQDGLSRLDGLEKMLGMATVDQMEAQAAAKQFFGVSCGACHKAFREGETGSYTIRGVTF